MGTSCNDVCDVVIEQLEKLGYTFADDEGAHDEILEALAQCRLERIPALPNLVEMGIIWQDSVGDYYALTADTPEGMEGDGQEILMGEQGKEAELEEWLRDHPIETWTHQNRWPEGEP